MVTKTGAKTTENRANPENRNGRYLSAGKGIYLIFLPGSQPAI
jgi:hypothetical protein